MPKTLEQLRLQIAEYVPMVDTPSDRYAHNIVGMLLRQIDSEHGRAAANEVIGDFELEELGRKKR